MKALWILFFVMFSYGAYATEIVMWHVFDGFLEEKFSEIIEDFNAQSGHPHVKLVQKADYKVVYEEGIDAYKKGKGPHILQVYEVATLSMMLQKDTYVPVGELMQRYQRRFDPDIYIDIVRNFYSAPNQKILSLPWDATTGILFYNKKAFKEAGLDPEVPPRTWPELERMGLALKKKGYVGYTTAWPAAYHLEHISCWHDLPFASQKNGFEGLDARLSFNNEAAIFHVGKVAEWSQKGVFSYSGRGAEEPENRFAKGECAILLQGVNRLATLEKKCDFEIGVGYIPYWPHIIDQPVNLNVGGASFWVLQGFSDEEYKGIVQLFTFLSSTEVQAQWHQTTGYLPITDAAYHLTKKKGFYETHPAAEIAVLEVMKNRPRDHSVGVRLGNYIEIRDLIIDYLEKAFSGEMTAREALNEAVKKGDVLLKDFEKAH